MKKHTIFILIILFISNSFAQTDTNYNYKITYQTKIVKPGDTEETKEEEKTADKQQKDAKKYNKIILNNLYSIISISELKIVENESTYITKKVLDEDEMKSNIRNFFNSITKNNGEYYYNTETNREILAKNVFGKDFLITNERDSISWTIAKEKKTICNFICYKATAVVSVRNAVNKNAKKNITVWFAPSIPLSFGPMDYGGLPGLILEVNVDSGYGNIQTIAEKMDLNVKKLSIKKPTKGQIVSLEEFEKISRSLFKNGTFLN